MYTEIKKIKSFEKKTFKLNVPKEKYPHWAIIFSFIGMGN